MCDKESRAYFQDMKTELKEMRAENKQGAINDAVTAESLIGIHSAIQVLTTHMKEHFEVLDKKVNNNDSRITKIYTLAWGIGVIGVVKVTSILKSLF